MGWAVGFDTTWQRDIGYGVPAYCDHPSCDERIDRGLSHVCGGEPYGGDEGCGLYFCSKHLLSFSENCRPLCDACAGGDDSFAPKKDHPDWIRHKLTDESWAEWRAEHPEFVERFSGGCSVSGITARPARGESNNASAR